MERKQNRSRTSEASSGSTPAASGAASPASPELERYVSDFLRDGFCILPGLFDRSTIQGWSTSFAPLLEDYIKRHSDPTIRGANRHYVTLPFRAPFADPGIFEHPDILMILERVIGEDFVMCQLATDTPMLGSDYQTVHSDAPPLFPETDLQTPSFQIAVNFPLCDVTLENGPLEITRGTHIMSKDKALHKLSVGDVILEPLEMQMGDVMIRDVRDLHRGTPNRTNVPRPMVVIGYSRKWLHRPEVSIQIPRAELEKLSLQARHMLRFNPIVESLPDHPTEETYKAFAY